MFCLDQIGVLWLELTDWEVLGCRQDLCGYGSREPSSSECAGGVRQAGMGNGQLPNTRARAGQGWGGHTGTSETVLAR